MISSIMKLALGVIITLLCVYSCEGEKKVVCYYTNWSMYRPNPVKFFPTNIDPYLCTHVLYAFTVLEETYQIKIHDPWSDIQINKGGNFKGVNDLKKINPSLKVLVAVGGWNEGGRRFSGMASSRQNRATFIDSAVELLLQYGFDGLDLDWEYPVTREGTEADRDNFSKLINELQQAFQRIHDNDRSKPKMLVTAAVSPADETALRAYDKKEICRGLDFVNLMMYDFHGGTWEKTMTGLQAPLYPSTAVDQERGLSISYMTDQWLKECDKDKLILGVPLYGRTWKLAGEENGVGAAADGPGGRGTYSQAAGTLNYYEICENIDKKGWTEVYDERAQHVYAYSNDQWVSYDNPKSVAAKMEYIKDMGLGGAMIWALDSDDFTGQFCNNGKYPLLSAINRGLSGSGGSKPRTTQPRTTTEPVVTTPSTTTYSPPTTTYTPTTMVRRRVSRTRRHRTRPGTRRHRTRPGTRRPSTTTTTTPSGLGRCDADCSRKPFGAYVPNPCDSKSYYICDRNNGFWGPMKCSSSLIFDPSMGNCAYNHDD